MELALPASSPGSLIERVTGTVKSLSDNIPLLVGVAGDVPADTKTLHIDIQAYKQSIENGHIQGEHEVAKARAEHVIETSSTTREMKGDVESTKYVVKTRKVVQTVTATKTRIMGVGPITPDMITSVEQMFDKVPLLSNTIFSWSLERSDANAITITQRILRPQALGSNVDTQSCTTSPQGISTSRSLIFIPREVIPYRQLTDETSVPEPPSKPNGDHRAGGAPSVSTTDTPKSERATGAQLGQREPEPTKKADNFVLEIKRKEGLRTLWQETAPIKLNRVADRLSRTEVELQENLFELLTSEASYAQSLSIVLKYLFNVDCVRSNEVVVRSDHDSSTNVSTPFSNVLAHGPAALAPVGGLKAPQVVDCDSSSLHVAVELEKLVKPLDRKALHLNLDELHRNSVSLLDALKKCWIAESCLMKPNFVQLLADRLGDTAFRAAYLAYLRDVRYQQELLRDLVSCRRVADASSPTTASPTVPATDTAAPGTADGDEHLCIAERYSRVELEKIRALLAEFHTLKCVENRALQSFLLLPLERLTKLKMCIESCEKLARKLVGNTNAVPGNTVINGQPIKESSPCALAQFGVDLDELRRVLSASLTSCCSLLDESNRLTYTCMQAEAQLQLDRLVRFEPVFGLHRISLVRTDRLFLKDDCGSLLRFLDARIAADREPSRKMSKWTAASAASRVDSLAVRLFLFSDLLLITTDSQRREEAFAHFGLATGSTRDAKGGSFIGRLRKSMSRKHSVAARRAGVNGPAGGKFACGTADLAHAISGTGSITVLDYAVISPSTVRVALVDTNQPLAIQCYPPDTDHRDPPPTTTPTSELPSSSHHATPTHGSAKPVRTDSGRLHRSKSTGLPMVASNADKQRRTSSLVRGKSAMRTEGQPVDLDSAILTYCEQQKASAAGHTHTDANTVQNGNGSAGHEASINLLRVTLHKNGRGEHADYVFRFTNESDAPRWFDALALAIRNRQADQAQTGAGDATDAQARHDESGIKSNVLRPHNASYGEELELAKGDVVMAQKRTADGWCKGILLDGSRSGWFRSSCIE